MHIIEILVCYIIYLSPKLTSLGKNDIIYLMIRPQFMCIWILMIRHQDSKHHGSVRYNGPQHPEGYGSTCLWPKSMQVQAIFISTGGHRNIHVHIRRFWWCKLETHFRNHWLCTTIYKQQKITEITIFELRNTTRVVLDIDLLCIITIANHQVFLYDFMMIKAPFRAGTFF